MLCLGIESSCDETSLALVSDGTLLGHVLASQSDLHALFGGVVPELASREHLRFIGPLFDELLMRCDKPLEAISHVAVSRGPGLLGSLLVGVAFAKGLALGLGIPLLGVNHLHAHLLAAGLHSPLSYPALGLLVSGGHSSIYRLESPKRLQLLGRTLDDACGECFDKVGNHLGMSYPSGRLVDCAAQLGQKSIPFSLPYVHNDNLDFSFSGLKTAVISYIDEHLADLDYARPVREAQCLPQAILDLCASFNSVIAKTLVVKLERALDQNADCTSLILAGGVAANSMIRAELSRFAKRKRLPLIMPERDLCTDNGAMVAYAGWLLAREGYYHSLSMETIPRGRIIPDDILRKSTAPDSSV
ncbi:MAG: tRNA (adenosine(37)-N6)-threonylcarbamoyltransferase complex transferase subunit TsaD [Desulfovibrio sp.]|nr:tRNA (adenosine(37)-N6)-threonylcarbamoyltransferase complex transferase subunit TsaD [Desulfovibrio sp.]